MTPQLKDKISIQALLNLPISGTPSTQTLQKLSIDATPLQILVPSLSISKVEEVIQYGYVSLDKEIFLQKSDYDIMTIEQMNILQQALERRKHQEILRREHMQKQALQDIKDIFLDAFNLLTPYETKPLIEQLTNIV